MPNVLIMPTPLRHRPGHYREILRDAGFTPLDPPGRHRLSEADLIEALADADALLAGGDPVTRRMIHSAPRLRAIARTGVGFESVDLAAASERGIPVAITPGANHESVAEHTLALALALLRNVVGNDRMVRAGGWDRRAVKPLRGTVLGVVGFGRIGRAVAIRARALGMSVIAFSRVDDFAFEAAHDIRRVDFDDLLRSSDVVSVNLPLNARTRGLFDRRAFSLMKPGAVLINTARGGLVVEPDLDEALASGHLGGAGLDVLDSEPPALANPLLSRPNVIFSPHIAGVDLAALDDMAEHAASIIADLYHGRWPEGCVVNEEILPSWRW